MAQQREATLHGRDAILKHFQDSKLAHWKLYNSADIKAPITVKLNTNKVEDSQHAFTEVIESLNPNHTFILDMFDKANGEDKTYYKPVTSMSFRMGEPALNGAANDTTIITPPANGVSAAFQPAMNDHIQLIHTNAQLLAEKGMALHRLELAVNEIELLKIDNAVLNEELDAIDDEDDDDDKKDGMFGNLPPSIENSIAKLIDNEGGTAIQYLFGSRTNGKVTVDKTTVDKNSEIYEIVESLRKHDPEIEEHLRRLLGIAQHMPDVFKSIIDNLDKFKEQETTDAT